MRTGIARSPGRPRGSPGIVTPATLRAERWIKRLIVLLAIIALSVWAVRDATAARERCESVSCLHRAIAWQKQDRARLQRELAGGRERYAIKLAAAAFHIPERDMRRIAQCESNMGAQKTAQPGSGASGLFQFLPSTFARTPFAHFSVFDPIANALAAGWLVRRDGGWREWSCSSITGVR